jgi:hypothetical protein
LKVTTPALLVLILFARAGNAEVDKVYQFESDRVVKLRVEGTLTRLHGEIAITAAEAEFFKKNSACEKRAFELTTRDSDGFLVFRSVLVCSGGNAAGAVLQCDDLMVLALTEDKLAPVSKLSLVAQALNCPSSD